MYNVYACVLSLIHPPPTPQPHPRTSIYLRLARLSSAYLAGDCEGGAEAAEHKAINRCCQSVVSLNRRTRLSAARSLTLLTQISTVQRCSLFRRRRRRYARACASLLSSSLFFFRRAQLILLLLFFLMTRNVRVFLERGAFCCARSSVCRVVLRRGTLTKRPRGCD